MDSDDIVKDIPSDGFLKIGKSSSEKSLSPADKAKLVRRGNLFLQEGRMEEARRVFITTRNTQGLLRVGDYYRDNQRPLEALKMYLAAPAPDRIEEMGPRLAAVMKAWISDEENENCE